MKANDLSAFSFRFSGYGHYKVCYTTMRGDYYVNTIDDMTLIDATKNAEWAKVKDIEALRDACKRGTHYNKAGEIIDE
jgi:hypothetical protein